MRRTEEALQLASAARPVASHAATWRMTAFVLMLLLGAGQLFLLAASASQVPACCRAQGRHHCTTPPVLPGNGTGLQAAPYKCCFFPPGASGSQFHQLAGIRAGDVYFAQLVSHPAVHAQTEAHLRISFDRTRQKRGPPSLNLS